MNRSWSGDVWLGPGLAYFVHFPRDERPHRHALLQVVIALQAGFTVVDEIGQSLNADGAVISSRDRYGLRIDGPGAGEVLSLFLEPNSTYGRALQTRVAPAGVATPLDTATAQALRACWTRPGAYRGALLAHEMLSVLGEPALRPAAEDRRVAFTQAHIAQHLADKDALDRVAEQLRLTTRYVRKLFQRHVGFSPQRYRQWCKLSAALDCVKQGSSFTTAAAAAGFTDSAHFSRTFRDIFGAPPSSLISARASGPSGSAFAARRSQEPGASPGQA